MSDERFRANWVGAPEMYNLDLAICSINEAFGTHCYHVGSSLTRREWRDVDVRCILPDDEFDALFPRGASAHRSPFRCVRLEVMNVAISEWLRARTGLPVDFQFQRQTQANEEYPSPEYPRSALGLHWEIVRLSERGAP